MNEYELGLLHFRVIRVFRGFFSVRHASPRLPVPASRLPFPDPRFPFISRPICKTAPFKRYLNVRFCVRIHKQSPGEVFVRQR